MNKTGIDLPGEASSIMHKAENVGEVKAMWKRMLCLILVLLICFFLMTGPFDVKRKRLLAFM